eukprot:3305298-Rhodomonas_salina.1
MVNNPPTEAWYEAEHIRQQAGRQASTRSDHAPTGAEVGGTAEMEMGSVGGTAETGPGTMRQVHSTSVSPLAVSHNVSHDSVT